MMKPLVYLASPYTNGDPILNTRSSLMTQNQMIIDNVVVPVSPLGSAFAHFLSPLSYEEWMQYDLAFIDHCDAVLRLDASVEMHDGSMYHTAESAGADREVAYARSIGLPVYVSTEKLYGDVSRRRLVPRLPERRIGLYGVGRHPLSS